MSNIYSFPGINFKKQGIVLTGKNGSLFFFDNEGRILYFYIKNKSYRIGLSGEIIEKYREKEDKFIKRFFSFSFIESIYEEANNVIKDSFFKNKEEKIRKIILKGKEKIKKSVLEFKNIYGAIPIVPPDMYLSLYVQITKGCSYNRCSFCNFYKKIPFKILSFKEFTEHINKIKNFFGKGLSSRRYIFLGDADALLLTENKIFDYVKIIKKNFKDKNLEKFSSFLDVWTGKRRNIDFWKKLKEEGLFRVYIGLESGSEEVLKMLKKPFIPEEFISLCENLKKAGINLGIIVLLGVAGEEFERKHMEETRKILLSIPFDGADILYLSPYHPSPDTFPEKVDEEEIEKEKVFFSSIEFHIRPRIAVYDIREFVY